MAKNKSHKQKFSSKHQLADKAAGRSVGAGSAKKGVKASGNGADSKQRRLQSAEALRKKKQNAVLVEKRIGSDSGVPRILGVIPANESGDPSSVIRGICDAMGTPCPDGAGGAAMPFTAVSRQRKMKVTFAWERSCNEQDAVDVGKASDIIILALDASQTVQQTIATIRQEMQDEANAAMAVSDDDEDDNGTSRGNDDAVSHATGTTWYSDVGLCITDYTRDLIASLNAQGIPSVIVVLQNTDSFSEKQRQKVIKNHQRYFLSMLPDTTKVISVVGERDFDALVRHIQVVKLRQLKWRDKMPYMIVEDGHYDAETSTLRITGFLRGNSLSANQLMHITNHGTFQVESIAVATRERDYKSGDLLEWNTIEESTEETRESLRHIQANETLEDAGLPTEADLVYEIEQTQKRKIRVPEGVSDYQAAWYDFEENVVTDDLEDIQHHSGGGEQFAHGQAALTSQGGVGTVGVYDDSGDRFADMDAMSYRTSQTDVDFLKAEDIIRLERMTEEERAAEIQRLKEESEEEAWNPDIVNTPVDLPARHRFSKYRGMKSFSTGKWDPSENLPTHYGYIFKLQGYSKVRDVALAKCATGPAKEGMLVTVTLINVPATVWPHDESGASTTNPFLIASGQIEHEQKWSVLHFQVQRSTELDVPIKSKTAMLAHVGFRKFYVSPLFSDVSVGDRTKFARYFQDSEKFRIASFFGPITFTPCPILLFEVPSLEEQAEGNTLRLACFGAALPPNPDLLIIKRTVLTGRVAVIHKKQIVVKYMFFNDDDVRWFQPVDLYTKLGRRGKIVKPVGTHGLYKAAFNDQVMQHDTICMDLFKRVYPKWTTVAFNIGDLPSPISNDDDENNDADEC